MLHGRCMPCRLPCFLGAFQVTRKVHRAIGKRGDKAASSRPVHVWLGTGLWRTPACRRQSKTVTFVVCGCGLVDGRRRAEGNARHTLKCKTVYEHTTSPNWCCLRCRC